MIKENRRPRPVSVITTPPRTPIPRSKPVSRANLGLGRAIGTITGAVVSVNQWAGAVTSSPLNKLWRARILLNRSTSPMPKSESDKVANTIKDANNLHYAREDSFSLAQKLDPWTSNKWLANTFETTPEEYIKGKAVNYTSEHRQMERPGLKNKILIINQNTSPATTLEIQNRPNELSINPASVWAEIKSLGRNNPFMSFSGSSDTISFEISWFVTDVENRDDVINKCKLLESWTKADSYNAAPPNLNIVWGDSEIFTDEDLFVLTAAPYTLTHFQDYAFRPEQGVPNARALKKGTFQNVGLKPNMATQSLTFKRVTISNRSHEDIISASKLERTPGITFHNENDNTLE